MTHHMFLHWLIDKTMCENANKRTNSIKYSDFCFDLLSSTFVFFSNKLCNYRMKDENTPTYLCKFAICEKFQKTRFPYCGVSD